MKRHGTDLASLLFGLIFLSVAGWWLVGRYVHLNVAHLGWIVAGGLIALGAIGVAGSLRRDSSPDPVAPVPTARADIDRDQPAS